MTAATLGLGVLTVETAQAAPGAVGPTNSGLICTYDISLGGLGGTVVQPDVQVPWVVALGGGASEADLLQPGGTVAISSVQGAIVLPEEVITGFLANPAIPAGTVITDVALSTSSGKVTVGNGTPTSIDGKSIPAANQAPTPGGTIFPLPADWLDGPKLITVDSAPVSVPGELFERYLTVTADQFTIPFVMTTTTLGAIGFNPDGPCEAGGPLDLIPADPFANIAIAEPAIPVDNNTPGIFVGLNSLTPITLEGISFPDGDGDITNFQVTTLPPTGTLYLDSGATTPVVANTPIPATGTNSVTLYYQADATVGVNDVLFQVENADFGFGTGDPATGTFRINNGTPPVTQPFEVDVVGDKLYLSCGTPTGTPPNLDPVNPCDLIELTVNLDGTNQTVTNPMNPIHVVDARGTNAGWTLQTRFLPGTASDLSAYVGFLNTTSASNTGVDDQIPAGNLSITGATCTSTTGAVPVVTSATVVFTGDYQNVCIADPGDSGGTSILDGTYELDVPGNQNAGLYTGTVEYLVF